VVLLSPSLLLLSLSLWVAVSDLLVFEGLRRRTLFQRRTVFRRIDRLLWLLTFVQKVKLSQVA
jgi:hypothetical protein